MAKASGMDLVIGILLIVLGALLLLGRLSIGFVIPILGVVLIVLGVLILVDVVKGSTLVGIASLVVGLLLALDFIGLPGDIVRILNPVAGIVLIILGALKLAGK